MRIADHQEILHLRSRSNLRWTGRGRKGKRPLDERERERNEEEEREARRARERRRRRRTRRSTCDLRERGSHSNAPTRKISKIVPAD